MALVTLLLQLSMIVPAVLTLLLAFTGHVGYAQESPSSATISLSLSPTPAQTIQGIGASGAWWPLDLYNYPLEWRNKVADMLFSEDGLRLTSFRYNLGGGGVFVGNPSRAPETFFVSPGVYNFSADPQGVFFLRKAAEANVPVLTAFINSAPPYFTSNNRSCGGEIVNATIAGYAQYIADVLSHWRSQGVHITHVSPMNEPDDTFGSGPDTLCGQEGMEVTPYQRSLVINTLRHALNNASLEDVGIMSDESSAIGNFIPEAPIWLPDSKSSVAAISHHQYSFADDQQVALLGETARNLSGGKETWFTEICCFAASNPSSASDPGAPLTYSGGFDPTMVGGLQMANLIYQAFTQTLDAHFDWWLALSSGIGCEPTSPGAQNCTTSYNPNGWNDGLLYYDPNYATNGNYEIYTTKRYFVMKHFSQFVQYGAVRYDVDLQSNDTTSGETSSLRALAFKASVPAQSKSNTASKWTLLVMNLGSEELTIHLPEHVSRPVKVVRTSPQYDWVDLEGEMDRSIPLPGLSITSFLSE